MKFLIALAVIAVAVAAEEVRVVHLPAAPAPAVESLPDIGRLIVPQSVLDALKALTINEKEDILRHNFDDAPLVVKVVEVASLAEIAPVADDLDEGLKVRFVDSPVQAEPITDEDLKVRFVDTVAEEAAPVADDLEGLKVRFVDSPVQAEPMEAVRIAEPVVPTVDAIKIVDAPRLGKVFDDPRLR